MQQRTIAETISCTGIGLHTGAPVHLTLRPAQPDTGLVFLRRDLPQLPEERFQSTREIIVKLREATSRKASGEIG